MLEVSIFLDEDDRYEDKPLHEHIMRHLLHHNVRGASMFAAVGGFGVKRHLHHPKGFSATDEGPIMIVFVDEEEKVKSVLPHLKQIVNEGLIILKRAEQA